MRLYVNEQNGGDRRNTSMGCPLSFVESGRS
jgi:hypothetical protein